MMRCLTASAHSPVSESTLRNIHTTRNISIIDLHNPTPADIRAVHEKFHIHLRDINYCLDPFERSRIKQAKDYTLIIYGQVYCGGELKRCSPIGFFFTKKYLIMVHRGSLKFVDDLKAHNDETKRLFHEGTEFILYRALYSLIKEMATATEIMGDELENIEDDVLAGDDNSLMHDIFSLRNRLLYLRKAASGNRDVINGIIKDAPMIKEKSLFADINIEIAQLHDLIEIYRERLTSIVEIHMSMTSNKINIIMKYFTVIASVLLLPMLITGLYGMNVLLPFQKHPQAFWIVIAFILACMFIMLLFFSKKKWL